MECQSNDTKCTVAKRRLILLLDGTWNDPETTDKDTNIVRLRDLLARRLSNDWVPRTINQAIADDRADESIGVRHSGGYDYLFFYERGVGTGPTFDRFAGGILGFGLARNVRRAYKFLSRHYRVGDEIFVFGFSRGAFTARSLVGYIGASGLLKEEHCDKQYEEQAWSYYRTAPNDRLPGARVKLQPFVHSFEDIRIACLGVFDTVGALGIPSTFMLRLNREFYQFHDVELSPVVRLNLHALAIDERRLPFAASVFRRSRFRWSNSVTEQTWFPGVHADIGGGYVDDDDRNNGIRNLDDLPLDWMIKRVSYHYPDFPSLDLVFPPLMSSGEEFATQHESRRGLYRLYRIGIRAIGNRPPELRRLEKCVSYNRSEGVVGETVHISAIERLGFDVPYRSDKKRRPYLPANLVEILPELWEKYCGNVDKDWPSDSLSVTAWDGEIVMDRKSASRTTGTAGTTASGNLHYVEAAIIAALDRLSKFGIYPVSEFT
ncbi:DUF2235 domain-containing protein [Methylobacterium sp. D53M]